MASKEQLSLEEILVALESLKDIDSKGKQGDTYRNFIINVCIKKIKEDM